MFKVTYALYIGNIYKILKKILKITKKSRVLAETWKFSIKEL